MSNTEDDAVTRARAGRHQYRAQAKRDRHADAQARHREKLRKSATPSRADFATVALGVLLLVCKTYPHDKNVRTMRDMIENELEKAGFDKLQIKSRLDRLVLNCDFDLDRWRKNRAWYEEWRQRPKPP
jgi:hypothetical protein